MLGERVMLSGMFKQQTQTAKILVADDDPHMVRLVSKILGLNGYEVITANDGLECLAKAEDELPDVILLDNMMPNLDGQMTLAKLKTSRKTEKIPVIMVTASADKKNLADAHKAGALQYIVKPFDYHVLIEKVAQALKAKHK